MKKLRDTKVGSWLKKKSPKLFESVADALPDSGILGVIKNLVDSDASLTPGDKEEFNELFKASVRIVSEKQITKRWQSDVAGKSWLSRNIRPAIVGVLVLFLVVFILLDTLAVEYEIREVWVNMYETILMTSIGGYFVVRTIDKNQLPWQR
jgi:hypothetical protein